MPEKVKPPTVIKYELMQPLVSFIVVNWNGELIVAECIESIQSQNYENLEVIVIDNGSSDGSVGILRRFRNIRLICNKVNAGFGPANNQALAVANGAFIAFVNNDATLQPDWLRHMLEPLLLKPEIGMSAGKVLCYQQPELIDNTGHLLYWDGINRGRGRMQKDEGQFDRCQEAFFPSGSACLFRAEMLREIGGFDEDFFLYGDDTELGIRARLAGWECAFVPGAIAFHRYSASTGGYHPMKFFFVERNRMWVVFKYFPIELVLLNPVFSILRYVFQFVAMLLGRGVSGEFVRSEPSMNLFRIWWQAQLSAWRSAPKFWRKRRDLSRRLGSTRKRFYRCFLPHRLSLKELAFTR